MGITDNQKREVVHAVYANSYDEIFEIITEDKWTKEMFVYFCRELVQEAIDNAG